MDERRADQRADVELDVTYHTAQDFLTAYSRNISGGGIFVRTPQPQPLNQKVKLRFALPGVKRTLEVGGIVVWANSSSTRSSFPSGMGIKFVDLTPEDQQLISDFVTRDGTNRKGGSGSASRPGSDLPA
jgi:uncharacterized protein (TIGR02266 family)